MKLAIAATINGQREEFAVNPHQTLLEFLRDDLKLKGAVEGCSVGVCGSCTVLIDGKPVSSCLTLAGNIEGKSVTTIEGLSQNGELDPVQQAFLKHQAFQCGFCTTGMIMAVKGLLNAHPHPSEAAGARLSFRQFMPLRHVQRSVGGGQGAERRVSR